MNLQNSSSASKPQLVEQRGEPRYPPLRGAVVHWGRDEAMLHDASLTGIGIMGVGAVLRPSREIRVEVACGEERFSGLHMAIVWAQGDRAGLRAIGDQQSEMRRLVQRVCAPKLARLQRLVGELRATADRISTLVSEMSAQDAGHVASILRDAAGELSQAAKETPFKPASGALDELRLLATHLRVAPLIEAIGTVSGIYAAFVELGQTPAVAPRAKLRP